jgi:hypothetical protein
MKQTPRVSATSFDDSNDTVLLACLVEQFSFHDASPTRSGYTLQAASRIFCCPPQDDGGCYNASLRRNVKMFAQLPMTSRTGRTRPLMKNGPVGEHNLKVFLRRKMGKFEQTVHVRKTCTHAYNVRTHTTLLQILMSPFYTDRNLPNRSLVGRPRPSK